MPVGAGMGAGSGFAEWLVDRGVNWLQLGSGFEHAITNVDNVSAAIFAGRRKGWQGMQTRRNPVERTREGQYADGVHIRVCLTYCYLDTPLSGAPTELRSTRRLV
ncbi:MAG: hypothetical protein HOC74_27590 [Gemmatimonadetes bacterium]|jgi:hypothetical protein|nr:hypothetical protein [Gemmatimonadota bacterium]